MPEPRRRPSRVLLALLVAGGCAAAVGLVAGVLSAGAGGPDGVARLPDLVHEAPSRVSVVSLPAPRGPVYGLAFRSAVANAGRGELIVSASRPGPSRPAMTAVQTVELADSRTGPVLRRATVRGAGSMLYSPVGAHQHWHLQDFDRFELRRASDHRLVAPSRKRGFCLGNRYPSPLAPGARGPQLRAEYDINCAIRQPGIVRLVTGLSPGYADNYDPVVEGQLIDVTRVPGGTYVLVHRANPLRRLREASYTNNTAAARIRLARRGAGRPTVRVLRSCLRSERCP